MYRPERQAERPDPQVFWKVNNEIGACTNPKFQAGYFGYKVLAVSYGGTLQLFGYKGTPLPKAPPRRRHADSGSSAIRGHSTPRAQWVRRHNSPARALRGSGTGSPGGLFFKWFHGHFGNGGGGNGGGGHHPCAPSTASATTASCGGGGGGGGLGGEAGTCASDLTVGTNTKLTPDDVPTSTGCSWLRLAATTRLGQLERRCDTAEVVQRDGRQMVVLQRHQSTPDEFVVTTTDYLPGHSEKLTITNIDDKGNVTFTPALTWPHRGTRFPIASRLDTNKQRFLDAGMDPDLITNGAETRAAVALLTRSIRIVSGGDGPKDDFEKTDDGQSGCGGGKMSERGRSNSGPVAGRRPGVHLLQLRRPCGLPPGLQVGPDPGRRIREAGPARQEGPLPHPFPHGPPGSAQHLHQGFDDQ